MMSALAQYALYTLAVWAPSVLYVALLVPLIGRGGRRAACYAFAVAVPVLAAGAPLGAAALRPALSGRYPKAVGAACLASLILLGVPTAVALARQRAGRGSAQQAGGALAASFAAAALGGPLFFVWVADALYCVARCAWP